MYKLGITATDTDIGKTMITGLLAAALTNRKLKTIALKPAASGCDVGADGKLVAQDAVFLQHCLNNPKFVADDLVAYKLRAALTPSVAAQLENVNLDKDIMLKLLDKGQSKDVMLVEGVGGLCAPLLHDYLVADFFCEAQLPIVLVIPAKLGSINQTLLSVHYARSCNLKVVGLIINNWQDDTDEVLQQSNAEYVQRFTNLPILGKFPKLSQEPMSLSSTKLAELAERYINIDELLAALR